MRRVTWTVGCALCVAVLTGAAPALAQDEAMAADETSGMAQGVDAMASGPAIPWEQQIDTFFERVAAGEPSEALDTLYAHNPWSASLSDQLTSLRSQFTGLSDLVGSYLGNERLAVQPVSDRFVYVWYLGFYDRQPLQFHFSFYKPHDRWLLFQFSYEEGVVGLAQGLAKEDLGRGGG